MTKKIDSTPKNQRPAWKKKAKKPKTPAIKFHGEPLYGIHTCTEALKNPARAIHKIFVTERIWHGDRRNKIPGLRDIMHTEMPDRILPDPSILDKAAIDAVVPRGAVHQGLALDCSPLEEVFLGDIIIQSKQRERTTFIMLDQVTDPHNIGAILRSSAAFGAHAIIGQTRHMPNLNATACKIACGGAEHVPIVQVKNLSETLEELKAEGFTCIGLDEHTDMTLSDVPKSAKTVIVLGAEGNGLRPKIAETCTHIAKLPTQPPIESLNVSNAAAIALYEISKHK